MPRKGGVDKGIFEKPLGSGKWYACWSEGGMIRRKLIGKKLDARAYSERRRSEAKKLELFPELAKQQTLSKVLERYRDEWARKSSAADDDRYARYWDAELGKLTLQQITPGHIEAWRSKRLAEVKGATINRAVSFLRRIFNLAIRDGLSSTNPAAGRMVPRLKEQRRMQYLNEKEESALLKVCSPKLRAAVEVAILTGMRAGEQFGMRKSEFLGDSIVLPRTKSGKTRYLPVPEQVQEILRELAQTPGEWMWPGDSYERPCDTCAVNRSLRRACVRAGIQVVSWHALRHTFGTRAVQRSDVRTVCEAMGHSSISVTEIYLQVIGSRLDALMRGKSGAVLGHWDSKNVLKYAISANFGPSKST